MFSWFKPNRRREIRQDRKHLEARARRLLKSYLSADAPRKQRYYEVIAGAAAACQPGVSDPNLENPQLNHAAAEAALKVVKVRERQAIDDNDQLAELITDVYATVTGARHLGSQVAGAGVQFVASKNSINQMLPVLRRISRRRAITLRCCARCGAGIAVTAASPTALALQMALVPCLVTIETAEALRCPFPALDGNYGNGRFRLKRTPEQARPQPNRRRWR